MQGNNKELEKEDKEQTKNSIISLEEYKNRLTNFAEKAKKDIENNTEEMLKEREFSKDWIQKETKESVSKGILEASKKKSIKQNSKVANKRQKKEVPKAKIAVCASIISLCAAVLVTPSVAKKANEINTLNSALNEYQEEIVKPNTTSSIIEKKDGTYIPVHEHKMYTILQELKEQQENPIIRFYLFYQTLLHDPECKNNYMNAYMKAFNNINNTDYTDLDDFLHKNNFENIEELKEYVSLELQAENIRGGR